MQHRIAFIVDSQEEVRNENLALRSLAQLALSCAAKEREQKEEAEEALAHLTRSQGEFGELRIEASPTSEARETLQWSLDE